MDAIFRPIGQHNAEEFKQLEQQSSAPLQSKSPPRPKKKPCCVCKMTKKLRDNCIMNNDEMVCFSFIEAHKQCLRMKGFRV